MGMGLCRLPRLYEMEPFVRICHGHFPLKQCTLEVDLHLVGHQSTQINENGEGSFSILEGND